jgi:SAM-dependent methyltransferase
MNCCATSNADTGRFFSWLAGLHRLRHSLLGFERSQRQLIDGIKATGVAGTELLEVGCGPGYLHQHLLLSGAGRAIGVDLSEGMLAIARSNAARLGLEARIAYRLGDFTQLAATIPPADIAILDKVVCCYPDWEAMLARSLERTRRSIALTYPRDRALVRAAMRWMSWALGALGCCFHPYVHDPIRIEAAIRGKGFSKRDERHTLFWVTQIYERAEV